MKKYLEYGLDRNLQRMNTAVEKDDWQEMYYLADVFKWSSYYIGAGRLHMISTNLQIFYRKDEFGKMIEWYPLFIECCIETKRWLKSYLASQDIQEDRPPYVEEQSALEVEIAEGYHLELCQEDDKVYCLRQDPPQTVSQRKLQAQRFILNPELSRIQDLNVPTLDSIPVDTELQPISQRPKAIIEANKNQRVVPNMRNAISPNHEKQKKISKQKSADAIKSASYISLAVSKQRHAARVKFSEM